MNSFNNFLFAVFRDLLSLSSKQSYKSLPKLFSAVVFCMGDFFVFMEWVIICQTIHDLCRPNRSLCDDRQGPLSEIHTTFAFRPPAPHFNFFYIMISLLQRLCGVRPAYTFWTTSTRPSESFTILFSPRVFSCFLRAFLPPCPPFHLTY